jgi:hypothetical protein
MTDPLMSVRVGAGFTVSAHVGMELGRQSDGKPEWAHLPEPSEHLIRKIVEFHEQLGECALEIVYCYPNWQDYSGAPSHFDDYGNPAGSGDRIAIENVHLGYYQSSKEGFG